MKYLLILSLLSLAGCGNVKRMWTGWTGEPTEYCYKGVTYLQFPSGATVAYDKENKVRGCE